MKKKDDIIKGAVFLFLGKIFTFLIETLQILLIPRILGPKNMGFYSYWLSVYFILARVLGLGGQQIIIRYVPELKVKNKLMIGSLIKKVVLVKFPVFFFIILIGSFFWRNELSSFIIIAFASLLFSLNLAGESVFYSHNWMGTYALIPLVRLASRTVLVIGLFYFFYTRGIVLGIFTAPSIAFLICLFLSFRLLPRNHLPLDQPFRKHFAFGFWIYISEALQGMIVWLITILSKITIQDLAIVGYFGVGVQICFSLTLLVYFINESLLPSQVEFHMVNDSRFKDSLKWAWKYTNLFLFPLVVGGYVLAEPFISFFIGKDYLSGSLIIKLFFPTVIFFSWIRFHNQILFVYERKIKIFLIQFINLCLFLGAWYYLIREKEINLAPLSLCFGAMIAYLFALIYSHKIVKVKDYVPNLLKPLMAATVMALGVNLFKIHSLPELILVALGGFLLYGFSLILFKALGKEDFKILKEFLQSVKITRYKRYFLNGKKR